MSVKTLSFCYTTESTTLWVKECTLICTFTRMQFSSFCHTINQIHNVNRVKQLLSAPCNALVTKDNKHPLCWYCLISITNHIIHMTLRIYGNLQRDNQQRVWGDEDSKRGIIIVYIVGTHMHYNQFRLSRSWDKLRTINLANVTIVVA